jgi:hypothetical protein
LAGEELLELGVGHQFGVILKHVGDALLLGGEDRARRGHVGKVMENVAGMMAPANASPNNRPNDPAAEFTPAAGAGCQLPGVIPNRVLRTE